MIHRYFPEMVDEDGHTKLINFDRCRRIHRRIRQIRGYEPPVITPINPILHGRLRTLVDAELHAIKNPQELYDWAQKRGVKLAAEEKTSYNTRDRELCTAGFRLQPPRQSSRQLLPQTPLPLTPQSGTPPSSTQPPDPDDLEVPRPLDLFNTKSQRCLDGLITRTSLHATAGGGNADIWEGLLGDQKVAIKCIGSFSSNRRRLEDGRLLNVSLVFSI